MQEPRAFPKIDMPTQHEDRNQYYVSRMFSEN